MSIEMFGLTPKSLRKQRLFAEIRKFLSILR